MDLDLVEFGRARSGTPVFEAPPTAAAPYEERAEWSARYVSWLMDRTAQEGALPPDVRDTHLYEVEFNSCVIDPQAYVRTITEERQPEMVH